MQANDTKFEHCLDDLIDDVTKQCATLVMEWTRKTAGSLEQWFMLMESVVRCVQSGYKGKLTGIEKAEVATATVTGLARHLWDQWTETLTDGEKQELARGELRVLHMVMENPEILRASTSFLKKLLKHIDRDGDGEISNDECTMFLCCGGCSTTHSNSNRSGSGGNGQQNV